jgi:hypothetical protein
MAVQNVHHPDRRKNQADTYPPDHPVLNAPVNVLHGVLPVFFDAERGFAVTPVDRGFVTAP